MLEILALWTLVLWFGGEFIGAIVGAIITGALEWDQRSIYLFALGGPVAGAGIAYLAASILSPVNLVASPVSPSTGAVSPTRGLSRNKKIAIGCGSVFLLLVCVCVVVGTLLGVLSFSYFGGEPENLSVTAEHPWTVREGDSFELILYIRNTGDTPLHIGDIDLDEAVGGSILDGTIVTRVDPPMERDYSVPGIKSFRFDRDISPAETQKVTFYLSATEIGEFGGSIGVYAGPKACRRHVTITVTPK